MRPYGIVIYPEDDGNYYPARAVEDGIFPVGTNDVDGIGKGIGHPSVIFFQSEHGRDRELRALYEKYPNTMFCPITVSRGFKTRPNPDASEFTINHQGVLPA